MSAIEVKGNKVYINGIESNNPDALKLLPTEEQEQMKLFAWVDFELRTGRGDPMLCMLFHVPNGGKRGKAEAARFKAQGVKSGVPDLCLPVPRGGYHGLYIELKRLAGGTVSREQKEWIENLRRLGYRAEVCKGWEAAAEVIEGYLKGGA